MIRHAPSIGLGIGLSLRGSGARFSGILDQYAGAAAAYSLRALSSAWLAGDVVEVRRSSDSTTQSFTANEVSNGTLEAFCGVGDGFVSTWYDQSGNGNDATQATTTAQPKIVDAGALVTGGLDFDGVDDVLGGSDLLLGSGSRSVFVVTKPNIISSDTIVNLRDSSTTGGSYALTAEVATRCFGVTWVSSTPASTLSQNLLSAIYTSGNLFTGNSMSLNGNTVVRTSGTDGALVDDTGGLFIGATNGTTSEYDGAIQEVIIYDSDQSANRAAIETNINDHYSIY